MFQFAPDILVEHETTTFISSPDYNIQFDLSTDYQPFSLITDGTFYSHKVPSVINSIKSITYKVKA